MKKSLVFLMAIAFNAIGQTPGTIVQTALVSATTTTVSCTLAKATPVLPTGVHIECAIGPSKVLVMDANVPPGFSSGVVGSFSNAGDSVTWVLTLTSQTGPISWQMAANGVSKSGQF